MPRSGRPFSVMARRVETARSRSFARPPLCAVTRTVSGHDTQRPASLADGVPTGERLGLQHEAQDHTPRMWRRIRPAPCTSRQRTVAIVCAAHVAGQARRLKPMKRLYASTLIRKKTALAPASPHGSCSIPNPGFNSLWKFSAWPHGLCQRSTSWALFSSAGQLLATTCSTYGAAAASNRSGCRRSSRLMLRRNAAFVWFMVCTVSAT